MSELHVSLSALEIARHCYEEDSTQFSYLVMLGNAALEAISSRIDATLYPTADELNAALSGPNPPERAFVFDSQTKLAALQLVEHWYRSRGASTDESLRSIPYGVAFLFKDKTPVVGG